MSSQFPPAQAGPDQPIVRRSLREAVREAIISRILTGGLPAGVRINESRLAEGLGVSQTPVREALLGLEGQGFLVSRPAQGFFVREFSEREVRDTYPVLAELEAMGLRETGVPSAELLGELEKVNSELEHVTGRPDLSIEVDERYHSLLLSGCPNRYLTRLAEQTRRAIYRYEYAYMGEGDLISNSSNHHTRIIDLLRRGRVEQAAARLRRAWLASVEDLVKWLERTGRIDPKR